MGRFKFNETKIKGLYVVEVLPFKDERGYFAETYNEKDFLEAGLTMKFVQTNESFSSKGVLRGLHFQKTKPQGKLVRCIKGEVFDVAVDLRDNSPTYGMWESIVLKEDSFLQFYIPEGFAHGFYVMSEIAKFSYFVSNNYDKDDEAGLLWNDKDVSIKWPLEAQNPILSEKDRNNLSLKYLNYKYSV